MSTHHLWLPCCTPASPGYRSGQGREWYGPRCPFPAAPLILLTPVVLLHCPGQSPGQNRPVPWGGDGQLAGALAQVQVCGCCASWEPSPCPCCGGCRLRAEGSTEVCEGSGGVEMGRDRESFGTALAKGDIHSRQTATRSMSETRPWRRDNRIITVKLEFKPWLACSRPGKDQTK